MRKPLAIALTMIVSTLTAGVGVGSASAAVPIAEPPACADIEGLEGFYDQENAFAFVVLTLAEPSCSDIVYSVFVYADEGDTAPIGGQALKGFGTDLINLAFSVAPGADDDGVVYVCAVTYRRKRGTELIQDVFGYPNADQNDYRCFGLRVEDEDAPRQATSAQSP